MIEVRERALARYDVDSDVTERISVTAKASENRVMATDIEKVVCTLVSNLVEMQPPIEGDLKAGVQVTIIHEANAITASFRRDDGQSTSNAASLGYRETTH